MDCSICGRVGIFWTGGVWFCEDCTWKYELMSAGEEEAWFDAEDSCK